MGEEFIENNNNNYIIIRPSTVYGEEDNFFNLFGKMAKLLPFLPLIKNGTTKFFGFYTILDLAAFCAYHCLLLRYYEAENSSPRAKDFRS